MNKSIKHISLALLFCIFTAHTMKNDNIISTNIEPFTAHGMFIPDDVLNNIFKYLYPSNLAINDIDKVNAIAEITQQIRSVCKNWYVTCNPIKVRKWLNWDAYNIAHQFNITSVGSLEKYYRHMTFLANTLKDQPDLMNLHNIIHFRAIRNTRIALMHGANPNKQRYGITPLLYAFKSNNLEAFKLLLEHGADIHKDSGNGYSILRLC